MTHTRLFLLAALVAVHPAAVSGQAAARTWPPWRTSFFPYPAASPNDGLTGVMRVLVFRQAASDDRVSLRSALALEGGYSTRETRFLRARVDLPRIAEGWRIAGAASASSEQHFGNPDNDLRRARYTAWGDISRRVAPRIYLAARLSADQTNLGGDLGAILSRYPQTPLDECAYFGGCDDADAISQSDAQVRAAVVVDLRDREYDTRRGALLEAGAFVGGAGHDGYTGGYMMANGWVTPREGTRLTARAGLRALSRTQAAAVMSEIPAWERPVAVLGGFHSHRALGEGELVGRGVILAGAEARHDLMNFGNIGAVTLIAFADAGRVFTDPSILADPVPGSPIPSGTLRLTLDGWTVGAGGGVAVRVLRNAQLTMTVARANEKTRLYVSTGTSW